MISAALLHDVVEDTEVTLEQLKELYDIEIVTLVDWLTDISKPEDGNRALRKSIDRAHTHQAPFKAQTIKVCDLIANTRDITAADKDFAKVYIAEKKLILEGMNADFKLMKKAWKIIKDYEDAEESARYDEYVLRHGFPPNDRI